MVDAVAEPMRKRPRRPSEVSPDTIAALNSGRVAGATLAECLAVDQAALMLTLLPQIGAERLQPLQTASGFGITRRMAAAADALLEEIGLDQVETLAAHVSDTVRGWAAFMVGRAPDLSFTERQDRMRSFADDPHFGVREWAWMALRPHVAADVIGAIDHLVASTAEPSERLRRFAVEATRPRGVWSSHIRELKEEPSRGLPLLEPLKSDPAVYVQDSVANWINDAGKDHPGWASALCARWRMEAASPYTIRICRRAERNLG